jgi:hypothetical protein
MNFPQLRMESTFGQIALNIQKPVQKIEQLPAELSIQQLKAELNIEQTPGQLNINQTQAREDMDLKSISRRIKEFAQQGYEDWLSGLARMSQDGDELMMIENGGNPIAEQAKRNSGSPIYDFNIGFIPSPFSVKINYQPSEVKLNWQTHKPEINVIVNKPYHKYTPGSVNIEMNQWPSLFIDLVGLNIDEKSKG